jgi:circadian clock protein KaiB
MRAKQHVDRYLTQPLDGRAEVEVIDLIADPVVARRERIVATPTLVRLEPAPVVRLIGDLTNFDRVRSLVLVGDDHRAPDPSPECPSPERPSAEAGGTAGPSA